jgi:hypothetical protein
MSQMTSLVKAEKAQEKDRVLVTTEAVRPRKAQAPTGRGLRTRPAMVERKMESNCHAWGETSGGLGTRNCTMRPTEIEMRKGMGLTPSGGGGDDEFVEEEAWMGGRRGLKPRESFSDGGKIEAEDRTVVRKERGRVGPGTRNGVDLQMGRERWWRREKEGEAEVEREWRAKLSMFRRMRILQCRERGEHHLFACFTV